MSAGLLLLLDPSLEKKEGRKQSDTQGPREKKCCISWKGERSRMQLPWYFINQLIYGLHTAL